MKSKILVFVTGLAVLAALGTVVFRLMNDGEVLWPALAAMWAFDSLLHQLHNQGFSLKS